MFEPQMELSDNFRYVIDHMFCCEEDDADIEQYVTEFIFDYFGRAYVTTILLGGVDQQNIFMNREDRERLERQGIQIQHQATIAFDLSMGTNISNAIRFSVGRTDGQVDSKFNSFMNETQSIHTTTLGGAPHLSSFSEWSKTMSTNPVITKFKVRDIFSLFNKLRFPYDPLIENKSKLIQKTLDKYLNGTVYYYGKCGSSEDHGNCESTGHFQFGICKRTA